MKKKLLSLLVFFALGGAFSFAGNVDHLFVEVKPNVLDVNQAADVVIKALDKDGNVVKAYQSTVTLEVEGAKDGEVVLPSDGMIEFQSQNEGVVTLSKGLIFKVEGTFKLIAKDELSESGGNIKGETSITVKAGTNETSKSQITITSPIDGSKEKGQSVSVIAESNLPNNQFEIYVDDKKVGEGISDENGGVNESVSGLAEGSHKLVIKFIDVEGKVLGESKPVNFEVEGEATDLFKSAEILPSNHVNLNEKFTINVYTDKSVTSAKLTIAGVGDYPMEKSGEGKFTKNLSLSKGGNYNASFTLIANSNSKNYPDKLTFTVKPGKKAVLEVKYERQKTQIKLSWNYTGDVSNFKVMYGTGKENLEKQILSNTPNAIIENTDQSSIYYVQVYPVDADGNTVGDPSAIIAIEKGFNAPSCKVSGIKLSTKKVGNKYYLVWSKVDGATKYNIYMSDSQVDTIDKMQKVGETTTTEYEYPFDTKSKKEIYKFYAVEAECDGGIKAQIDKVKKIKVGPFDSILFILIISTFIYVLYKLNLYSRG